MKKGLRCEDMGLELPDGRGHERMVLRNVTAVFPPGRIALVAGDTGAGKTSLIHVLACLIRPTQGRVIADDRPVSAWTSPHQDRWRRGVGIAFQHPRLLERLTALENVMLPLVPFGGRPDDLRQRAVESMERLGIAHLRSDTALALSGGEAQRTALARALVASPRFVFADEPTSHQDSDGADLVKKALGACRREHAVVVVTTHDSRLLDSTLPDNRYRLVSGRLEALP
ncbi:MAG: ATP-binding cassette domain-containing protein [Desulfobacteraceae bacterium]|nr:ATP-binding cassette domain-containing protein [Desulfobacteraceae bacterium]